MDSNRPLIAKLIDARLMDNVSDAALALGKVVSSPVKRLMATMAFDLALATKAPLNSNGAGADGSWLNHQSPADAL
jgi:hypothetical protein